MVDESLKRFFEKRDLAYVIDALAKRYSKMPYDIVTQQSIYEFNFNIATMTLANIEDRNSKDFKGGTGGNTKWQKFGVNRTVVKKEKIDG